MVINVTSAPGSDGIADIKFIANYKTVPELLGGIYNKIDTLQVYITP